MRVTLVGAGMGTPDTLTLEADAAFSAADAILGAERILAGLPAAYRAERIAAPLPEDVLARLSAVAGRENVCVALSGDIGFHSGARRLLELLAEYRPQLVCGVSTPQYLAARLRRPWQDMKLASAHGVACDVLAEVLNHPAVVFLAGGRMTPAAMAGELCAAGLGDAIMTIGENLSLPDERVGTMAAGDCAGKEFAPLCAVLIENARTFVRETSAAGIADDYFIRGAVPMTKREARALALSLLEPKADSVLYDVGAGTGAVAVEMALLARRGRVFAVERSREALSLIAANRTAFGAYNLRVVAGTAPVALSELPPPDAAFIGGTGGRMRDIIAAVLAKNSAARLVVSAIALETLHAATAAMEEFGVRNVETRQIAAARTVTRGEYHMLEAANPIFLISGGGRDA